MLIIRADFEGGVLIRWRSILFGSGVLCMYLLMDLTILLRMYSRHYKYLMTSGSVFSRTEETQPGLTPLGCLIEQVLRAITPPR